MTYYRLIDAHPTDGEVTLTMSAAVAHDLSAIVEAMIGTGRLGDAGDAWWWEVVSLRRAAGIADAKADHPARPPRPAPELRLVRGGEPA